MDKRNLNDIVKPIVVGCGITALFFTAGCSSNYDRSPVGERIVQRGDNLTKYAKAEGLTEQKDINKYISAMQRANDNYVAAPGGPKKAVGQNGEIYEKTKILMLDINRDGKVGTKEDLHPYK